uniref:Uncharacterized protein n=1 Tax=Proboscia inermis TaxID=420281 RepID=A0A6T8P969_9STRA|mmetsp:Transcript_6925/g.7070  ORF Transcript_6925/g.7070 Transcript_6925/m.7070 type:complete len:102 (+) Transcript_6925:118-423(+)
MLWEKLGENGLLVIIKPGTPNGFQKVRSVQQMLLECCPPNGSGGETEGGEKEEGYGAFVVAPCTHNGTCSRDHKTDDTTEGLSSMLSRKLCTLFLCQLHKS